MTTAAASPNSRTRSDTSFYIFNAIVSLAALGFLGWLLLLRRGGAGVGVDLRFLPAVNACLNATAAALLTLGWIAIKQKRVRLHKFTMVSAFAASALFFVCYAIYHYAHGDTRYQGEGPLRTVYFVVLITHIVLSASVPPLALTSFYYAWRKRFATHRKVTRVTVPIWLYVSVTGVLIFFMLRGSAPAVP
jgi:putative membrane protein